MAPNTIPRTIKAGLRVSSNPKKIKPLTTISPAPSK